ncbi:hypothetical protein EDB81DRAFT_791635 [Dactylonectria macrodidyma]|uniref:Uncharacterized protein n=1 Tax=Dactylonectria macrodidyma TaxID=307937 RepID=A0A9P9F6J8_9HYPO|nr:hypothetical protein EDB81DRAFT_791635 [Dactylonectria macrodidyma]
MPPPSSSKPISDNSWTNVTSTRLSPQLHKRPLEASELPLEPTPVKQAKVEPSIEELYLKSDPPLKPQLKASDLEFDYDRTQLRDRRPTPGRENRPRLNEFDMNIEEFKTRFSMPWLEKPKRKGPNAYALEVLADPTHAFHHLYVCHKEGPNGRPTYDNAGYQLDWKKVDKWMKPQGYSKRRVMSSMNKASKEAMDLEELLYSVFFVNGKGPDGADAMHVKNYIMDHMSKDLGIPWHQVKLKKNILAWEEKGFPRQDAMTWWHEPNAEEKKRMWKMIEGGILRKDMSFELSDWFF